MSVMDFFEKISRKLSGSRSNDGVVTPDKPSSRSSANDPGEVRHVPPHVRNRSENHQGDAHPNVVNGKPGIIPTPNVGSRNEQVVASRNTQTTGTQPQPQPQTRQSNGSHIAALPAQTTSSSNVPPISRLNDITPASRHAAPKDTNSSVSTSGQQPGRTSLSIHDDPQLQQQSLQSQPSISSSLHSSRSPQSKVPNMVSNQQAVHGNMRGPPDVRQADPPKSAGRDTRRMEDGAYHAGFRDAVAQLEREREAQGRRNPVSN